jgi:hypothetical protein
MHGQELPLNLKAVSRTPLEAESSLGSLERYSNQILPLPGLSESRFCLAPHSLMIRSLAWLAATSSPSVLERAAEDVLKETWRHPIHTSLRRELHG